MTTRSTGHLKRWARVVIGVVVALLLSSCSSAATGPDLEALQDDVMAKLEIPGLHLQRRSEQERTSGSVVSSKPSAARIIQTFVVEQSANGEDVLSATADVARAAGWDIQASGGGYSGTRQLQGESGTQTASVSIYLSDASDPTQQWELTVIMQNPA